jgi:pimeloyl-ACP methyl ester carboxylesterase
VAAPPPSALQPLSVSTGDGTRLAGEQSGEGPPIVLLHGLTATRRYVVMGSRLLERSGYRTIAYDARGHGSSDPAPNPDAYGYARLSDDLLALLDAQGVERALIAGASMGAHTAIRFALEHPERVAALAPITPSYDPEQPPDPIPMGSSEAPHGGTDAADTPTEEARTPTGESPFAHWDALASGLRAGGIEGFMAAYDLNAVPKAWRETVERVVRQRLAGHEHPGAVADALESVPRSRPFERWEDLRQIMVPAVVVASRDEADPDHPLAVAERYAQSIPGARVIVEDAGPTPRSPIAWQGGQLSKVLLDLAERARFAESHA